MLLPTTSLNASARIIRYSHCIMASEDSRSGSKKKNDKTPEVLPSLQEYADEILGCKMCFSGWPRG